MSQDSQRILIIGGGLGGLALAQALKKSNISFHVFERDEAASWRAQGYRIRIVEDSLKKLLPENLWPEFENTCAELVPGFNLLDASTAQKAQWNAGGPRGGPPGGGMSRSWNADRTVLRNVLLTGLVEAKCISFGKRLVKYDLVDDGVIAHFSDGSSERGSTLIGADGARSVVRKQFISDFTLLDTEGRAIFGKTPITPDLFEHIPKEVGQGICTIGGIQNTYPTKLFCDVMTFKHQEDTTTQLPPDYIYWVLCLHKDSKEMSDHDFMSLNKEMTVETSLELTKTWHESCRNILTKQNIDATSALAFLTASPDFPVWKSDTRITLLGDAAHPMVPVGGVGANTAFVDAAALYDVLKSGITVESIASYEEGMRRNAAEKIKLSAKGAGGFFGMKPLDQLEVQKLWT